MNALYTLGKLHDGAVGPGAMTLQEMNAIFADLDMTHAAWGTAPREMEILLAQIRRIEELRGSSMPADVKSLMTKESSIIFANVARKIQEKLGVAPTPPKPAPAFPSWMIPVAAALAVGLVLMSNPRE